jgi:hypothetical protein
MVNVQKTIELGSHEELASNTVHLKKQDYTYTYSQSCEIICKYYD